MMSIFTDKHADEEQKSFEEAGKGRVLKWEYSAYHQIVTIKISKKP